MPILIDIDALIKDIDEEIATYQELEEHKVKCGLMIDAAKAKEAIHVLSAFNIRLRMLLSKHTRGYGQ